MSERLYIDSPLFMALWTIAGKKPPSTCRGVHHTRQMDCKDVEALGDWCSLNARPAWSTGIGMLEAAELIVEEACANANIRGPGQ